LKMEFRFNYILKRLQTNNVNNERNRFVEILIVIIIMIIICQWKVLNSYLTKTFNCTTQKNLHVERNEELKSKEISVLSKRCQFLIPLDSQSTLLTLCSARNSCIVIDARPLIFIILFP